MSSYVKALEGVMRLFPKKIKVTFEHAITGELIGIIKIYAEQLPEKFKRPTTITAFDKEWRVLGAEPMKALDFFFTKKLTLRVYDVNFVDPNNYCHFFPTLACNLPAALQQLVFRDLTLPLQPKKWRQLEFLPLLQMANVQNEIDSISKILKAKNETNLLLGYEEMHIRENISQFNLALPYDKFCESVNIVEEGSVSFDNGFCVRSANNIYYGTVKDNVISNLCLYHFDCLDDEIYSVLTGFDAIMVDWVKAKILTGEVSADGENFEVLNQDNQQEGMF